MKRLAKCIVGIIMGALLGMMMIIALAEILARDCWRRNKWPWKL